MNIENLTDRPLTTEELAVIDHFVYYLDGETNFVYIGGSTALILLHEECESREAMLSHAAHAMHAILHQHPDFSVGMMDDMYARVMMEYGLMTVSPRPLTKKELDENNGVPFDLAIQLRNACLDACHNAAPLALVTVENRE
ncbi:MAG: hypothetical protein IJY04_03445 [Clostridia bacterium]|nr:hypothetical protein [Clostridia bacterium]